MTAATVVSDPRFRVGPPVSLTHPYSTLSTPTRNEVDAACGSLDVGIVLATAIPITPASLDYGDGDGTVRAVVCVCCQRTCAHPARLRAQAPGRSTADPLCLLDTAPVGGCLGMLGARCVGRNPLLGT